MAVNCFFILSGYLIVQSWLRTPQIKDYLSKRILRIYPSFLAACLLSLLIVGPIGFGSQGYLKGLSVAQTVKSFLRLQPSFPNSFPGSHSAIVNGSLWTIPYEFLCYLLVLVLGMSGLFRSKRVIVLPVTAVLLMTLAVFNVQAAPVSWFNRILMRFSFKPEEFYRLTAYFFMGAAFYFYQEALSKYRRWSKIGILVFVLCLFSPYTADYAMMTIGTVLLFEVGLKTHSWTTKLSLKGDYSYGMYLYGWPIQKLLILEFPKIQPLMLTCLALPLSFCAGAASWCLIEKPFLKLKPKRGGASAQKLTSSQQKADFAP